MENKSVIMKNEQEANVFVARVMRITAAIMTLILILNIVGIFIIETNAMIIAYITSMVLLLLPTLLVNILKIKSPILKYLFVIISVLFISILIITLNWHSVVVFIFAIGIASLYFTRGVNVMAVILSIVAFSVAEYVAFLLGFTPDANEKSLYNTIVFVIVPRALSLYAMSAIFMSLNKRTTKMLSNLLDADAQSKMVAHLQRMKEKSMDVTESMTQTSHDLNDVTENTTKQNENISDKAQKVTRGSGQMQEQLNEASESIVSISENLGTLATRTGEIAGIAKNVHQYTKDNNDNMQKVISNMEEINKSTESSKEVVTLLNEKSQEILSIIDAIQKISSQTNMLALNAAIESARAGEQGKGFAVVAGEIQNLAEQTSRQVGEIKEIVDQVLDNTQSAVESMEISSEMVRSGLESISVADASTRKVTKASEQMNEKVEQIDEVTKNVAQSSENIVEAVGMVEQISSSNLEDLQDMTNNTKESVEQMKRLSDLVELIEHKAEELESVVME